MFIRFRHPLIEAGISVAAPILSATRVINQLSEGRCHPSRREFVVISSE